MQPMGPSSMQERPHNADGGVRVLATDWHGEEVVPIFRTHKGRLHYSSISDGGKRCTIIY